ncbi:unnamed protein product [Caretta caretta]
MLCSRGRFRCRQHFRQCGVERRRKDLIVVKVHNGALNPYRATAFPTKQLAHTTKEVQCPELLEIPGLKVRVVTTERAKHFYNPQEIPVTLYSDTDEWQLWKGRTDPILHIDLRRWADLMLVAPLDANTLAKIANGICDNLLTCVIRAWDMTKPLLFCPAMNTAMWEHPITAQQVEQLKDFGYMEIPCVVKRLVCGDEGRGAMAEVWTIVEKVKVILSERDLPTQR